MDARTYPKLDPAEEHFSIAGPRPNMHLFLRRLSPATPRTPDRKAVLYAHGATFPSASSIAYRLQGRSWRDSLCAADFDVWGLDFYGFGHSARYPEMGDQPERNRPLCTSEDAAGQLLAAMKFVVEHSGVRRVSLISHSWGSFPAGRLVVANPDLVDRWVMFAPIGRRAARRYETPPTFPAWRLITGEDQWKRFIEDVPEHEIPVFARHDFDEWAVGYLRSDPESRIRNPPSVKTPLGPFSEIIAAWHGVLPYDPALVRVPVAIIRGEWDGLLPDEDARSLFDALASSPIKRDIKIGRATHLIHLEAMRGALWHESACFLRGDDAAPMPPP